MNRSQKYALLIAVQLGFAGVARADASPCTQPATDCRRSMKPARDRVVLMNNYRTGIDTVLWRWTNGKATSVNDFGDLADPNSQMYICVYSGDGDGGWNEMLAGHFEGGCTGTSSDGSPACWTESRNHAYELDLDSEDARVNVKLQPGRSGQAGIRLVGQVTNGLPAELPVGSEILVQFRSETTGVCWESHFSPETRNPVMRTVGRR